jgi:hypothetical protein
LDAPEGLLAYLRSHELTAEQRVVLVNFTASAIAADLPAGEWTVDVSSAVAGGASEGEGRREGEPRRVGGSVLLAPDEAVILRRV